jgi:hypothetical protein
MDPDAPRKDDNRAVNRAGLLGACVALFIIGLVLVVTGTPEIGVFPMVLAVLIPFFFGRLG